MYALDEGYGSGWARAVSRPQRAIESVIMDSEVTNELLEDANEFLKSAEWYADMGIPYRRCYLLHGKPGCGKTR